MSLTQPNKYAAAVPAARQSKDSGTRGSLANMNPEQQPLSEKRRRGRLKGSKNGPNAGTTGRPVGRPRKDGSLRVPPRENDASQKRGEF